MDKWMEIMNELTSPSISPRLEDRIHQEILIKAEQYKKGVEECAVGKELFGQILLAHQDYVTKHGRFGDMFGDFLTVMENLSRRHGQVFTPIHITQAMTSMVLSDNPEELLKETPKILDPASGTGRFMLATAEHYAKVAGALNFIFFNIDIDFTMYVYCSMNAILNGIPAVNVWGDSLAMEYREGIITIPIGTVAMWKTVGTERLNTLLPKP